MEIKSYLNDIDPYRAKVQQTESKKRELAQAAKQGAGSTDKVSLSNEGRLRTEAFYAASNAPEIREAKVEAIREKMANGSYQIDSKKIAARLIAEEPELFAL